MRLHAIGLLPVPPPPPCDRDLAIASRLALPILPPSPLPAYPWGFISLGRRIRKNPSRLRTKPGAVFEPWEQGDKIKTAARAQVPPRPNGDTAQLYQWQRWPENEKRYCRRSYWQLRHAWWGSRMAKSDATLCVGGCKGLKFFKMQGGGTCSFFFVHIWIPESNY